MPVPKGEKPWWPDRIERDNPDDPNDLSGRPATPPNSYEESLMNQAGGDDKGLTKPDPNGDSEPSFRSYEPSDPNGDADTGGDGNHATHMGQA